VGLSFNAAWTPYFYRVADDPQGPIIYRQIMTLTTAAFLWMALGLSATSGEVIAVIARPGYAVAAQVLPVVAFASVMQGVYTMLVGPIFLRRRTALLPLLTVASAATNVLINLYLIPRIGVMGSAWATLAAYSLFAALTFAVSRRVYPLRLDYLRLLAIAVICVIGALVADMLSLEGTAPVQRFVVHMPVVLAAGGLVAALLVQPVRQLRRAVSQASAYAAEM
jgi:O-antigen/teichoic acid export membrane protein